MVTFWQQPATRRLHIRVSIRGKEAWLCGHIKAEVPDDYKEFTDAITSEKVCKKCLKMYENNFT